MSKLHLQSPEGKRFALFHPKRAEEEHISDEQKDAFEARNKSLALERVEQIRSAIKEAQRQFPEVLGICIYGSTVKGTLREQTDTDPGSDIDGFIYIDAEGKDVESTKLVFKTPSETLFLFKEPTQTMYEKRIRGIFKESLRFTTNTPHIDDEKVAHVKIRPISNAIIDRQIQDILPWAKNMIEYEHAKKQTTKYIAMPNFDAPSSNIADMFHLAVGKGIESYRSYLLTQLQKEGEAGEIIWKRLMQEIENIEQNLSDNNLGKNYPRNIEDALRVYGNVLLPLEDATKKDRQ